MACFLVPMALAIALLPVQIILRRKGKQQLIAKFKLSILSLLLWGGVIMLAVEHVAHQEIVPFFPFLTAMKDPADTAMMLHEMVTLGSTMAISIVGLWGMIVFVSLKLTHLPEKTEKVIEAIEVT